jgi:UDP-glucose 4-epimerase
VTGGAGFIGSHLVDGLLANGHEVAVVDDLSTGRKANVAAAAVTRYVDLASEEAARFVASWKPARVFHLAAQVSLRDSVVDPIRDARTNVLGSIALLESLVKLPGSRLVFASTGGGIYGDTDRYPTPESCPVGPLSPYGCAKRAVEEYLGYYRKVRGLRSCSLRFANVYGPRQDPAGEAGVVAIFSGRAVAGRPLRINGDGSQTRDYVYVGDVAQACLLAADREIEGIFNVGTGVETSVTDLAREIRRLASSQVPVEHGPAVAGDAARSCLDASRLESAAGWRPRTSLADGLSRTVDWFRGGGSA